MISKTGETDAFWTCFCQASDRKPGDYELLYFGAPDRTLMTELAGLVLCGRKQATTTQLREIEEGRDVQAKQGDLWLVVDGNNQPICVVETTRVDIMPFGEVDAEFAHVEGEGDRSLAFWRRVHIEFFSREAEEGGYEFSEQSDVVLERFHVIYPQNPPLD